MSKKQMHTNGDGEEAKEGIDYVTTTKGEIVELTGVSPTFIAKLQSAGIMPSVPYREIKLAFGDEKQKEDLSENDLRNDEETKQWQQYIEERNAVIEKRNTNIIRAIFAKGTRIDESKIEEWKQEQVEIWGLEIPGNPVDVKVSYIQDALIGSGEDIVKIVTGVLGKTGIPEKEMEAVRAMFRSSLRRDTSS